MSSELRNPMELVHSLEPQMGSTDNYENDPIANPFSIRHYVLTARQKDISRTWPFPERYLQVCLKHGIRNVLPALEPWDSAANQPQKEVNLEISQGKKENDVCIEKNFMKIDKHEEIIKVGCDSYFDEAISEVSTQVYSLSFSGNSYEHGDNNHLCSGTTLDPMVSRIQPSPTRPGLQPHVDKSTIALTSPKRLRHKRRKHKGKPKKRSLADILAVAKHCTLKEPCRVDGLGFDSKNDSENVGEGSLGMSIIEHGCESELAEDKREKHQRDDKEALDSNIMGQKRLVMKIKLNQCDTKSMNGELNTFRAAEIQITGSSKTNSPEIYGSSSNSEFKDASQGDRMEV